MKITVHNPKLQLVFVCYFCKIKTFYVHKVIFLFLCSRDMYREDIRAPLSKP